MKISVIVTSYNQKDYLVQALDSLLAQTCMPYEIIVCDDGSTDGSRQMIEDYTKTHPGLFIPVFQPENLGVAKNRNTGLALARGDYVTTLDGDDVYAPEKLEKELEVAVSTGAPLVYSDVAYMDETGRITGFRYKGRMRQGDLFEETVTLLYPHPREILIRRDCLEMAGLQDERLTINEDFEWVIRLAGHYEFAAVCRTMVFHRLHDRGLSRGNRLQLLATQVRVMSKMVWMVASGAVKDRGDTLNKLTAFRELTRAREFEHLGDKAKATVFLAKSMAQDPWRSAAWDLWFRLHLSCEFKRPHKIPDRLRIGPLALPYYITRAMV